jgi:ligand-binding SRPBCC domain-containing protein
MKLHTLKITQQLRTDIKTAWDFFSSPANLKNITPPYLGFKITSELGNRKMYPGMIITYKVSPIAGIKMNWATEITHVEDFKYFVDEQRFGPYAFWHHQHHFEENSEGVFMTDIVTYGIPWYGMGALGHDLVVKPKLKEISDYRKKVTNQIFNTEINASIPAELKSMYDF